MKNTIKLFGIIAIVTVIGFSMVACGDEDSSSDAFEGYWGLTDDETGEYYDVIFAWQGDWQIFFKPFTYSGNSNVSSTGTYKVSGNTVSFTLTQFYDPIEGLVNVSDLTAEQKAEIESPTFQGTLSGRTITIKGVTYTRNPWT